MAENRDIDLREYQLILLDILKDVAAVCKKNNIRFYLGEGSMLGAVRHKGFIPWDDDIDIIMYRKDYNRFLKTAPADLGDKYEVQSHGKTKNFWNPYAQVRLITDDRRLRQGYIEKLLKNNGPFVDIFPMDYVPKKSSLMLSFRSVRIKFYKAMLPYIYGVCKPASLKGKVISFFSRFHRPDELLRRIDKITGKYGKKPLPYTANFHTTHPLANQIAPTSCYDDVIETEFEGVMMPIPEGYDEILTIIYGDYMTPPKEKERVNKHKIGSER